MIRKISPHWMLLALPLLSPAARSQEAAPQQATLQQLISGKQIPLTLTMKDLTGDWRRLAAQADPANYMQMMMGAPSSGAYYTKGETVSTGGETFVVAYKVPVKPVDFMGMMRGQMPQPTVEKLTPDTLLILNLMNLRTMGNLSDIRIFDLNQEIAAREAELATAQVVMSARGGDATLNNLKQMTLGLLQYAQDYNQTLPELKSAAAVKKSLYPYIKNDAIFVNPRTKEPFFANPALSGVRLSAIKTPAEIAVFYEATPGPDGQRAVAFVDGHVKRVSEETEWPKIKEASKIP